MQEVVVPLSVSIKAEIYLGNPSMTNPTSHLHRPPGR